MSIDAKVKELRELRRMADSEIEAIQDSIKGQMDTQGGDGLEDHMEARHKHTVRRCCAQESSARCGRELHKDRCKMPVLHRITTKQRPKKHFGNIRKSATH